MNDKYFIACIIILILLFNFCKAEEKISLDVVIKESKENNPEIKMLQNKYLAAVQKITEVKTWEYPQLGVETNGSDQMYFIYQMLPFPGKLSLKSKVAEYESKIIEQELNSKIREVVAMVKKTYWNYWLINKIIEIYHENIDLMKRFLNIANTQYAIGKLTQTDVLKANTEVALMENMLVMFEQEKVSTQAELNALLNRPPEAPLGKPEKPKQKEIKYTYEEIKNIALKNSPEIKAKEYLYQRNISALSLSKREWYPDIMVGLKIDNMFNRTFMAQISVPLYYKKQFSIVEMSKKEKDMSEWDLQATKINTLKRLKNLWSKYESIKKSIKIYENTILPLAKQTLEIAEASYRVGKNNFLDLLYSQRKYLDYNINYYKLITEKETIIAELEQSVGIDLK
jgi:cobalt-zinc-cadmium efflux system outer membrane protein